MPVSDAAAFVRRLCPVKTPLAEPDIERLERVAETLPLLAELTQSDVFVDCLTHQPGVAIVVAEARPTGRPSLYRSPVVGQLALQEKEPGVLIALQTGEPSVSRGLTQEEVPVRQSVVPIKGEGGRTVGALIMEQDISEEVRQEVWTGVLAQTTEQLADSLFSLAMKAETVPSLLQEGLLILDAGGFVLYANPEAVRLVASLGGQGDPVGQNVTQLPLGFGPSDLEDIGIVSRELHAEGVSVMLRSVPLVMQQAPMGRTLLLRDVTEIRAKEKELMVKSAVIKEIHHRVKNNLQTIASLLRLQARRSDNAEIRRTLAESINRIASIAMVHEVLSQGGIERVDLRRMTEDIVRLVRGSMVQPERGIAIEVDGDAPAIASAKATSVALIINELVQNAIDHAFPDQGPGNVEVRLEDLGNAVRVQVTDDGTGLPDGFSSEGSASLGLQIVRTLVEHDLRGRLAIGSRNGGGTLVTVDFAKGEGEPGRGRASRDDGPGG